MSNFAGTPRFYDAVTFDADIAVPYGTQLGLTVGKAGTVNTLMTNGQQKAFTVAGPADIQGEFLRVLSSGTVTLVAADITVARR